MQGKILALKIDVDTHDGMKKGVPALLEVLEALGLRATFCLSFGPDNAGKAIFQIFKDKNFLKKMIKTGAPSLYGFRTILSGTILPPRPIATAFPEICRDITAKGHEAIVHAWDHRKWQDHVHSMTSSQIEKEFEKAFAAFKAIYGKAPRAVAAPGWQVSENSLIVQDGLDLLYASDLRQGQPCFLKTGCKVFRTLQIPSTGPCIEELLTIGIKEPVELEKALLKGIENCKIAVLALHAEVEGGPFRNFFYDFAKKLPKFVDEILPLEEIAKRVLKNRDSIPIRELGFITLPGRAGLVATGLSES